MAQPIGLGTQNDTVTQPEASSSSSSPSATEAVVAGVGTLAIAAATNSSPPSSPPRPITPRSPKDRGEHPLKHIAVSKGTGSPRRMTEQAAASSPRSDSLSRAMDAQILEPLKQRIEGQIAQMGDGVFSPDRLVYRARLHLQLAQAVHNDLAPREAALQRALEDLQSAWDELNKPAGVQVGSFKSLREVAEQFEAFGRLHSSAHTAPVSLLAEQCLEKIRNLEAEKGKPTARFSLPGTDSN